MAQTKSEASRARWAKIPPEQRTEMMRAAALKLHNSRTPAQRRAQALKMVKGRNKQRKLKSKVKTQYVKRVKPKRIVKLDLIGGIPAI